MFTNFTIRKHLVSTVTLAISLAGLLSNTPAQANGCVPDDMNWCPHAHQAVVVDQVGAGTPDDMHW
jgi:hypothetical protein